MTTKIPVELSSTPGIVDGSNATAITIDSSENISINSGDVTLATASKRYYVPRASDAAATGSLYSPAASDIRLSGAGSSAGELQFEPSSTSGVAMTITSAGNVGIGTSSPAHNLDVISTSASTDVSARIASNSNTGDNDGTLIIGNGGTGDAMLRFDYEGTNTDRARIGVTSSNQHLQFFTAGANERMRILSTGLVAIGTTVNTVAKMHIVESESRDCLRLTNTRNPSSSAPYVATFGFNYQPNNGTSTFLACQDDLDGSPTNRCIIQSNGGIANYQSNNSNLSDARLKTDIQDAPNALDIINNLKVRTFKYHDQTDEKIHTGLIAQEAETVDLSLVNQDGWADKAPDGEEPYKSIYSTDLMFKMLKAIQEQQEQIEQLKTEIQTLKGE